MKNNNKTSLISGLVFFILGIIIFLHPDTVVKFASYCLGGLLIGLGLYKIANYYIQDKRLGVVNRNEMAFGITAVVLGVLFIFLAGTLELLLRFIVGGWLVIAGLGKIGTTFYTTDRDSKFYALIVVGVIYIGIGLYIVLVSNLALSIVGLFMMIYGLTDFISYFVYRKKQEIIEEEIKEEIAEEFIDTKKNKDEIIIETEFEEKELKKTKK
ncbi:MAG: DUF308 domain-containing protein [Bacilli bacterium]|nr:DUF308 domain-containing protein [Bacilli bacterium]